MEEIKTHITKVFKQNYRSRARIVINVGGARSSKSYSIAQLLILKADGGKNKNIGITRKTMPALKMTSYRLVMELLKKFGLYKASCHNKSENYYELNGNRITFFSLDEPEKIKSAEFNYIWMEEATEFAYEDYITLLTRLSGKTEKGERNQLFMSLNPSDENSWIRNKVLKLADAEIIKSTYKDNPFLSADYAKTLEGLKEQDESFYKIYALGQWGAAGNLVFENFDYAEKLPPSPDEILWGLDFGYNNPTALVQIALKDNAVFARQRLYSPGLTNAELIKEISKIIKLENRFQEIYADCAEPSRIEEISRDGFNVLPADKNVLAGIDVVKRRKLSITRDSSDLIRELQSYKWKTDKDGRRLDAPVKFNDHAVDALRYALHTHFKNRNEVPEITTF